MVFKKIICQFLEDCMIFFCLVFKFVLPILALSDLLFLLVADLSNKKEEIGFSMNGFFAEFFKLFMIECIWFILIAVIVLVIMNIIYYFKYEHKELNKANENKSVFEKLEKMNDDEKELEFYKLNLKVIDYYENYLIHGYEDLINLCLSVNTKFSSNHVVEYVNKNYSHLISIDLFLNVKNKSETLKKEKYQTLLEFYQSVFDELTEIKVSESKEADAEANSYLSNLKNNN